MIPNFKLSILFSTLIICLYSSPLTAQCPTNTTIAFNTQDDIDAFKINYPDCKDYVGNIRISATSIYSLSGLSNLETVSGELKISGTINGSNLYGVAGLENLREVGTLHLYRVYSMSQFHLENLESVDEFYMGDMKELQTISDETNFKINRNFTLRQNRNLYSLGNISCSSSMDTINLFFNSRLTNYELLSAVDTTKYLEMWQNYDLQLIASEDAIHVTDHLFYKDKVDIKNITVDDSLTLLRLSGVESVSQFIEVKEVSEQLSISYMEDLYFLNNIKSVGDLIIVDSGENSGPEFSSLETVTGELVLTGIENMPELDFMEDVEFLGETVRINECQVSHINQIKLNDTIEDYYITLISNPNLSDINALNSVDTIAYFYLRDLPALNDFSPLNNLRSVRSMTLDKLDGLYSLDDFQNLNEICTDHIDIFSISDNPNLENLDGLENVVRIGDFDDPDFHSLNIRNNPKLKSIYGLRNMVSSEPVYLDIENNPLLSICSIDYICNVLAQEQYYRFDVSDNGIACNSIEDIQLGCGFKFLRVFFDENQNGLKEIEEHFVSVGALDYNASTRLLPNNEGTIAFDLRFSNPGAVSYDPGDHWEVTTGNDMLDTSDPNLIADYTEVGIYPMDEIIEVDMSLAHGPPICDLNNFLRATFKNIGTAIVDVESKITIPGALVSAIPEPIESINETHEFLLTEILPGQTVSIDLEMISPNVIDFTVGDTLDFKLSASISAENLNSITDTIQREEVFLCAYDPNDKSVAPVGVQEENYTLFDTEKFDYLIRFQNTGNFPATDITIRDTLSEHLDVSTFKFNDASHPVTQIKIERDAVRFYFKDINLIDSVANEALSHGYISYSIEPFQGLEEMTEIKNTAHIYFDSNPPIVTNTTLNTMVSEIPGSTSVVDNYGEENSLLTIFPNPVKDELNLKFNGLVNGTQWSILDVNGRVIMSGNKKRINIKALRSGVYFLKTSDEIHRFIKTL